MTDAKDVLQETRTVLLATEDRIRNHRYVADLAAGRLSMDAFKAFPGHQYHMWKSDMRSAAHVVSRFGERSYGWFFNDDLQSEIAAKEGVIALGQKLDMSEEDLNNYEPSASGFAFAAYFAWLAVYGSAAEIGCGLALNLSAWGANCSSIGKSLREQYGFTPEETVFFDGFGGLPSFEGVALEIIQDELQRGVSSQEIVRAARLMQSYEEMFWDTMSAIAE